MVHLISTGSYFIYNKIVVYWQPEKSLEDEDVVGDDVGDGDDDDDGK